jgi:hypothetical protein
MGQPDTFVAKALEEELADEPYATRLASMEVLASLLFYYCKTLLGNHFLP